MRRRCLRVTLFGPQGCGKGTQGQLLADRYGVPLIGSGDVFREEIAEGTALGRLVDEYVRAGVLAPDELVHAIVRKHMQTLDAEKGFVLDGYPRNVEQAAGLDRWLPIYLAIQLKLSDVEAVHRLEGRRQCASCRTVFHIQMAKPSSFGRCSLCGGLLHRREDDKPDIVRHRLEGYHYMTEPLAAYYRQRGVLLVVNADQTIEQVFADATHKMQRLGFYA